MEVVRQELDLVTARKRGLRRLSFHMCLSVHRGVSALLRAGIHTLGQTPPRQTPPLCNACWGTVNKWAIGIPLECILVLTCVRGERTNDY